MEDIKKMNPITLQAKFYTPKYKNEDPYNFIFDNNNLTVQYAPNPETTCARATWDNLDSDAIWTEKGKGLFRILANDLIHPPHVLPDLLEYLWKKWRLGELKSNQLQEELIALIDYVNACQKVKPTTEFWQKKL